MRTYTFHVSLPDYDKKVWRKIELPADATLDRLHLAIQDAYAFDKGHPYSFFMSGRAWDHNTEYTLLDDEVEAEEESDDTPTGVAGMPADLLAGLSNPTPDQIRQVLQLLQSDPAARQQFMQMLSQQMGIPPAMVDMLFNNMQNMFQGMSDAQMNSVMQMASPIDQDADDEEEADDIEEDEEATTGDVLTTSLDDLQLYKGQNFLYLFDADDEWHFKIRVDAINETAEADAAYPRLVESTGEAPAQYAD